MIECFFELNSKPMSTFQCGHFSVPAFSGRGSHINRPASSCHAGFGPIPPGSYYIFDREVNGLVGTFRDLFVDRSEWFALYAIDGRIDDEIYCDSVKRGNFRLHPKGIRGISEGCITVESHLDYHSIRGVIKSSHPVHVPGSTLKAYGRVVVQ